MAPDHPEQEVLTALSLQRTLTSSLASFLFLIILLNLTLQSPNQTGFTVLRNLSP